METIGEIPIFQTLFLRVQTDFLTSGNHFFFFVSFLDTLATDSFIFPVNGSLFVNKSCILVSQSRFSD